MSGPSSLPFVFPRVLMFPEKKFLFPKKRLILTLTFYRNDDLSTTCQRRQLKLNLLSTQINFYCVMTNQTPALLVRTTRSVNASCSSIFLAPLPPRAIMPDARPLVTFESQDGRH